jgi:putative glutamine amidotransferase
MTKKNQTKTSKGTVTVRPRILVLEALSGSARCVRLAGGDAVVVNPRYGITVEDAFNEGHVDALLLTGGGDVDPRRYGKRPHPAVYGVNETRDRVELMALDRAVMDGLPVLGICRGSQVMNVAAGGTLYQHLPVRLGTGRAAKHKHGFLPVYTTEGTLIAEAFGSLRAPVQHLHHQSVARVGRGYRASAWHADGTIEAIESTDGVWRVGAQFHPEYAMTKDPEFGLFRQLVVQAALVAGLDVPPVRRERTATVPAKSSSKPARSTWRTYEPQWSNETRAVDLAAWRCWPCRTDFDTRADYIDHMFMLHDVDLLKYAGYSTDEMATLADALGEGGDE